MDNQIRITCRGAIAVPYQQLVHFQGNLKDLSETAYQKLKATILKLGFSEPISVWENDGAYYVLNGHQRLRCIKTMVETEGYVCPDLPVSIVEAVDIHEAKLKVLSLTSQYGDLTNQGLYEFMSQAEIGMDELTDYDFPEIDLPSFDKEYFAEVGGEDENGNKPELPDLPSGDRKPLQQMTFTLHDLQAEQIKLAIDLAISKGAFIDTQNENSNGNALARICETYLTQNQNVS